MHKDLGWFYGFVGIWNFFAALTITRRTALTCLVSKYQTFLVT